MRRQGGFTFVEILVALLLLAVALSGLMGLWAFGFGTTRRSADSAVAYSIARCEVEQAKNYAFLLLPESQIVGGAAQPIWTDYFDGAGHLTASGSAHFTATTFVETIPDANGQRNAACLRTLRVQVRAKEGNELVFDTTTYLSQGGI